MPRETGEDGTVVEAVREELGALDRSKAGAAGSAMAAAALVLAAELDDPTNSATSKSMCSKELRELMGRLHELAPSEPAKDGVDELRARRERRVGGAGA